MFVECMLGTVVMVVWIYDGFIYAEISLLKSLRHLKYYNISI